MGLSEIEAQLSHLSYRELSSRLEAFNDDDLVNLLNSRSAKIGDTAATLLFRRSRFDLLVDRLLDRTLNTKLGKIRCTNVLNWGGRKCSRSIEVYRALLSDRMFDVLSNVLFGLSFLQDKRNLPVLVTEAQRRAGRDEKGRKSILLAIEAIEKKNPFVYSPYFKDLQGVWELDQNRFPQGAATYPG